MKGCTCPSIFCPHHGTGACRCEYCHPEDHVDDDTIIGATARAILDARKPRPTRSRGLVNYPQS